MKKEYRERKEEKFKLKTYIFKILCKTTKIETVT